MCENGRALLHRTRYWVTGHAYIIQSPSNGQWLDIVPASVFTDIIAASFAT